MFYVDLFNGRAVGSLSGDPLAFPSVVAGGTLSYGLRFLEFIENQFVEKDQALAALRVGVGPVDQRPLSGVYRIKIGLGATQVGVNTTTFLSPASRAVDIAAALNALTGKQSAFVCMDVGGGVMIRRTDGAEEVLSVNANRLVPVSFVRFTGVQTDGEWSYELRLVVAPYAFSDSAAQVMPDPPTIRTLVNGGADSSNTVFWNEIQELRIPRLFRGVYQIRYGQYAKTSLLDIDDGAPQIQQAINDMLNLPTGRVGSVEVTNPFNDVAHIEFVGDLAGTDVEELEVVVFSAPPGDWTFELPLDRAEMFFALRDQPSITVPFEAEADFYNDPNDPTQGVMTRKLWQTNLTILRPQIMPYMAEAPSVDWLRLNPPDYVPFTPQQVVTGPQAYQAVFGDGQTRNFVIDHGLNTAALSNLSVRRNTQEWETLTEGVDFTARIEGTNSVALSFGTASVPAPNSMIVSVQAASSARDWEPHTHTQEQIIGLKDLLDAMLLRIAVLEEMLPSEGVAGVTSGQPMISFELPNVGEILPDVASVDAEGTLASQIVITNEKGTTEAPAGTDVAAQETEAVAAAEAAADDPDALPPGVLYRALLPGIGSVASKGKKAEVDDKGNVLVEATPEEPAQPESWPMRSASMEKAGRWPYLLPAVYYGSAVSFGGNQYFGSNSGLVTFQGSASEPQVVVSLPSMGGSTRSPVVYKVHGGGATPGFMLPAGGGRKSQWAPAGSYFAADGRCYYRVYRDEEAKTFYPLEMDRELWRVVLTEDQFPLGAILAASGEIRIRMLGSFFDDDARGIGRVDFGGQYFLRCEALPLIGTSRFVGPAGTPITLGNTRIGLSSSMEMFNWSLSILREATGPSTSWQAYGKAADGSSFPLPAVLRLRLTGFDIDDAFADESDEIFDPRGQVALIAPSSKLSIRQKL